jgi:hypothetical protein
LKSFQAEFSEADDLTSRQPPPPVLSWIILFGGSELPLKFPRRASSVQVTEDEPSIIFTPEFYWGEFTILKKESSGPSTQRRPKKETAVGKANSDRKKNGEVKERQYESLRISQQRKNPKISSLKAFVS